MLLPTMASLGLKKEDRPSLLMTAVMLPPVGSRGCTQSE
jgi:hypothetical protein